MDQISRRRLLTVAASGVTLGTAALLSGCSAAQAPVTTPEIDEVLRTWVDAVRTRDRTAHDRVWAAAPSEVAAQLRDSLLGLELSSFDATRQPGSEGPGAVQVQVVWGLPDDRPIQHIVQVVPERIEGRVCLARVVPAGAASPLWWIERVTQVLGDRCGLLVGGPVDGGPGEGGPGDGSASQWAGRPVATWQHLVESAVAPVAERTGRTAARVWVQLPSSTSQLQATLGVSTATLAEFAGLAWPVGEGHPGPAGDAPVHVFLDPTRAGALADAELAALLRHELVHVVTEAPHTGLPLWVEEGYAEAVTWADDSSGGWAQAAGLVARAAAEPVSVPGDEEFSGTEARDAYARSWTLCQWQLEQGADGQAASAWTALRSWYDLQAPVATGVDPLSESEACRRVYGIDPAERLRRWRAWLGERGGR